jgi:hypothetical protein
VKGSADNTLETRTLTQASGVNNKIGMMYDITGRGDQSFNDSAGAGLDKAKADFGIAATESTPTGDADRADRLALLASGQRPDHRRRFLWGGAITAARRRTRTSTSASSTRSSTPQRGVDDVRRGAGLVPRGRLRP